MELRPRIATKVAMIVGGLLFAFGLPFGFELGGLIGIVPAALGLLGVLWVAVAIYALTQRKKMRIRIDAEGIEIPAVTETGRALLRREEIQAIAKHESLRGRQVQVSMSDGRQILLSAREYCELNDFISYCRNYGLPT